MVWVSLYGVLPDQVLTSSVPMYANNAFAAGFTQLDTAQWSQITHSLQTRHQKTLKYLLFLLSLPNMTQRGHKAADSS